MSESATKPGEPKTAREQQIRKFQQEFVARLRERNAVTACPQCKSERMTVLQGFFAPALNDELGTVKLGGTTVPLAVIVCENCGHVMLHALGALGLLSNLPGARK